MPEEQRWRWGTWQHTVYAFGSQGAWWDWHDLSLAAVSSQGAQPGSSTLQTLTAHLLPASLHDRYRDAATNKTPGGQDLVWPTSWWTEETNNT